MNATINGEHATISREQRRIDSSHDELTITMQGARETQEWMRIFPDPIPEGHVLRHEWDHSGPSPRVRVWTEPEGATPIAPMKAPVGNKSEGEQKAIEADARKTLQNKTDVDLETIAGENGVTFTAGMSKAQRVAALAKAIASK